jgi:hypothetical protein
MAGVLLTAGQTDILNTYFGKTAEKTNLYLALLTGTAGSFTNPATSAQIGSGITEDAETGYTRTAVAFGTSGGNWTLSGSGPTVATFNATSPVVTAPSGGLANICGWALCKSNAVGTADAVMAGAFPANQQGSYASGDTVTASTISFTLEDTTGS